MADCDRSSNAAFLAWCVSPRARSTRFEGSAPSDSSRHDSGHQAHEGISGAGTTSALRFIGAAQEVRGGSGPALPREEFEHVIKARVESVVLQVVSVPI